MTCTGHYSSLAQLGTWWVSNPICFVHIWRRNDCLTNADTWILAATGSGQNPCAQISSYSGMMQTKQHEFQSSSVGTFWPAINRFSGEFKKNWRSSLNLFSIRRKYCFHSLLLLLFYSIVAVLVVVMVKNYQVNKLVSRRIFLGCIVWFGSRSVTGIGQANESPSAKSVF